MMPVFLAKPIYHRAGGANVQALGWSEAKLIGGVLAARPDSPHDVDF